MRASRTTRWRTNRRLGFTLIELLVVMATLAALAAMATTVYFRVREAALIEADERIILKYNTPLNAQYSAERDDANDAFDGKKGGFSAQVDAIRRICSNDSDRARAVWLYLWMQNAFPQTFEEAKNPINFTIRMTGVGDITFNLPARSTFLQMPTLNVGSLTEWQQSGILLHRILTQKGTRGQTLGDDVIGTNLTTIPNTTFQMLNDARGRPLIFVRWANNGELDDPKAGFIKPGGRSADPFDPRGKTHMSKWTLLDGNMMSVPIRRRIATVLRLPSAVDPATMTTGPEFSLTRNFMPTIIGVGSSKIDANTVPTNFYPNLTLSAPSASPYGAGITTISEDEGYILGYKLRRPGRRGDS